MKSGTIYTNQLSHSKYYLSWQQASEKSKIINWQVGIITKDSTGYWDNWYTNAMQVSASIAGKEVVNGTYSNVSGGATIELARGSVEVDSDTFIIKLAGWLYNTGNVSAEEQVTIDLSPDTPVVSISEVSHTATSITIKCTDTNGIASEKYHIYNGDTFLLETTNKEIIIDNLNPNTTYNLKAYGYANGSFGNQSNILSVKTSAQSTITDIGDFSINGVNLTLSGEGNIVVIVDEKEVIRRDNVPAGQYELILTEEEKETIYKLIGNNNNSIDVIIRVETGNSYVDIEKSITLTGDVFSCNVLVNGVLKKGKVWIGTANGNKQGIFTIGTANGNVRGR